MENNNGTKIFIIILIICLLPTLITVIPFIITVLASINVHLNGFAVILIILGIIICYIVAKYNKFVSLRQKVNQARGGIDVYLKQRFDLIPNLVETVKGYKNYEAEVIEKITKLRYDFDNRDEKNIKQSEDLNERYTRVLALVENYPELKANESFLNLQKVLSKIESQLQAARRIYNSEVTVYNTEISKFPSNIIANVFGFEEEKLFEIAVNERENIRI